MAPPSASLYQINTRIWLKELGQQLGHAATLDHVKDETLDRLAELGFDWIWMLGVWQTGPAGRDVSLSREDWRAGFLKALPDLRDEDIVSSPFAVRAYTANTNFGGDEALIGFRDRLRQRGMHLMLDYVPNHTALDHAWVWEHPEYYIAGSEDDLKREPHNYYRAETRNGWQILAYGRDPYFPGWPDALQLNYRHPGLRQAMTGELLKITERCDGVRCDMAMLLLPNVIQRTWGARSQPTDGSSPIDSLFWPTAIEQAKRHNPNFILLAEVYWDLEWELQQQGFDYTYDKRLYDRLLARQTQEVLGHLNADLEYQRKSARFLENHDEHRAAEAFPLEIHLAAAVISFLTPGMRFFHEGQLEGRRQQVSNHLGRRRSEPVHSALQSFYKSLLQLLKKPIVRNGGWRLLDFLPGNPTSKQLIAFVWEYSNERLLVVVNYAPTSSQGHVRFDGLDLRGRAFLLRDRTSHTHQLCDGTELLERGLYLQMEPWAYHIFDMLPAEK